MSHHSLPDPYGKSFPRRSGAGPADESQVNVGLRLAWQAGQRPEEPAIVMPRGRRQDGQRRYEVWTFRQLEQDSNRIASGLLAAGVPHFSKLVLMVRPSPDFISLVFALFKAGMVTVLIDPGMGRRHLAHCLTQIDPDGFVAIPLAQAVRAIYRQRFPNARYNVTVGRRWFWGGRTLKGIRAKGGPEPLTVDSRRDDDAAIIFTTGSTGPPKGVRYSHGNFETQASEIGSFYGIEPGERDLPGFPLFALFNCVLGVTTVIPEMDFTRPAEVDGATLVEIANDWKITQAFGSPALWNTVGRYLEASPAARGTLKIPTLKRVLSAGAPVPLQVMQRVQQALPPDAQFHTPYGATEALPVASISAAEVERETDARTRLGAGVCVGKRFPRIHWRVIEIREEPLATVADTREVPRGTIGELMVQGPVVTREYVAQEKANALHKVIDGESFWHRMGDVGYLDDEDRFWFCGRKTHRVQTAEGTMYPVCCEAIINQHNDIYRSALVGVILEKGVPEDGQATTIQTPVLIAEPWPHARRRSGLRRGGRSQTGSGELVAELHEIADQHELTRQIEHIFLHPRLPVDIRHNAKIFREKLIPEAEMLMRRRNYRSTRPPATHLKKP